MLDFLSNRFTEKFLREMLIKENYNLSCKLKNVETGTDI